MQQSVLIRDKEQGLFHLAVMLLHAVEHAFFPAARLAFFFQPRSLKAVRLGAPSFLSVDL